MSEELKELLKKNLQSLFEGDYGFEDMEVAFGVKHKSDNLTDEEKAQFGGMEDAEKVLKPNYKPGSVPAQTGLDKVNKDTDKEAVDYYKDVANKMKDYQKPNQEAKPSTIGEAIDGPKRNAEDSEAKMGLKAPTGTGMEGLRYDDEGTENYEAFEERVDELNDGDEEGTTYGNMKKAGREYKEYKYGDKYDEVENEYQETPRVRTTTKESTTRNSLMENEVIKNKSLVKKLGDYLESNPEIAEKAKELINNGGINEADEDEVSSPKEGAQKLSHMLKSIGIGISVATLMTVFNDPNLLLNPAAAAGTLLGGAIGGLIGHTGTYINKKDQDEWDSQLKHLKKENKEIMKYSDVIEENIFKTKGNIVSEEQVIKVANKIPSRVKIDETVFAITDGENYYRLMWEGTEEDGEAIITHQKNEEIVNESVEKMKHLWGFKSSDVISTKKNISENNEDVFKSMLDKMRNSDGLIG
jgi:hypothetical protein